MQNKKDVMKCKRAEILIPMFCIVAVLSIAAVLSVQASNDRQKATEGKATIELKDGTTVVGQIQGTLVLGGQAQTKKLFGAIFFLVPGKAVVSITKKGVEVGANQSGPPYALFASKKPLPSDTSLILMIQRLDTDSPASFNSNLEAAINAGLVSFDHNKQNPIGAKLLGEFRTQGQKQDLIPTLTVNTTTGPRAVAVDDIVDYIQAAKK